MAVTAEDMAMRISELTAMLDERKSRAAASVHETMGGRRGGGDHGARPCAAIDAGRDPTAAEGPALGIYTLCVDADERLLPEECQTVITATPSTLRVESNIADDVYDIMPDLVSANWLDAVSMALAPIEDGSPSEGQSAIPDSSRLLDLLELTPTPEQIEARWAMYPRSTSCLIGESVDGAVRPGHRQGRAARTDRGHHGLRKIGTACSRWSRRSPWRIRRRR